MKGREQLLREILDDLRWIQMQGRSTLNRSHTTVEAKKKSIKSRRSSVTLSKIKEESGNVDSFSSTSASLPRSAAINVKSGRKMLGLHIPRSASASAGSRQAPSPTGLASPPSAGKEKRFVPSSLPRRVVASKPGLSTIEASPSRRPKRHSPVPPGRSPARRSPLHKSPPHKELNSGGDSPQGKVRTKSKGTKLKQLGESVEYPADDEEMTTERDTSHIIVNSQTNSPAPPRGHAQEEGLRLGGGRGGLKGSPSLGKKKMVSFEDGNHTHSSDHTHPISSPAPQFVVAVEVHSNGDVVALGLKDHTHMPDEAKSKTRTPSPQEKFTSSLSGSYDHTHLQLSPNRLLNTSITSETKLLPDSESGRGRDSGGSKGNSPISKRRRRRSKSPNMSSMRQMLSISQPNTVQGDEGEMLLEQSGSGKEGGGSPYFAWEEADSSGGGGGGGGGRKAFSWDRNSGGKGPPHFSDSDSD